MEGWVLLLFGALFFPAVYTVLSRFLDVKYSKFLNLADRYLITEKCVSSVQAILATFAGYLITQRCNQNIMADISPITKSYACFGLPYFLYDIWAIYNTHYYINEEVLQSKSRHSRRIHFIRKNIAMLVHHIVLPFIFFPIIMFLRNDKGDYFVGLFYMCEAAVPFISLRFVLAQLNQKHTAAYIFTGVMMIVVFFIVRVCIFPFLYWKYSDFSGIPLSSVPFHIPLKCNAGCLVFLVVQVYFLYIMVHGAVKFFYKIFVLKSKGR